MKIALVQSPLAWGELRGVKRNAINRVVRKNGNGFDK